MKATDKMSWRQRTLILLEIAMLDIDHELMQNYNKAVALAFSFYVFQTTRAQVHLRPTR